MIPELQAVILAGGEGSKMFPLTEGLPKCLLPIGNMPLIWYVVKYLEKSGILDLIIIVQQDVALRVTQVLHSLFSNNINFDVVSLPDQDDVGTTNALCLVKDKIKTDVLVVSSDMMTDVPLHRLIDIHRTYDSSFTALFTKRVQLPVEQTKTDKKKQQLDPNHGTRDLVALDKDEGRLLFLSNEADLEQENISFKKSTLKRYPQITIDTELTDCHLYVMKKWVIDYLSNTNRMENFKSDFIPHLLRKQFSKKKNIVPTDDMGYLHDEEILSNKSSKADIFSYSMPDELTTYLQDWSSYSGRCLKDQIKCHGFIADENFCLRVNTLPAYTHMNREIGKFKDTIAQSLEIQKVHSSVTLSQKSQIGNDCMIGKSSSIGNNVTIKKSIVGENCIIGSNVRISNCILMNNVKISDGCNLQGSIICENADIQQNCSLTSCQVSSGYTLKENSDIKNEAIVQEEMEFED